MSDELRIAKEPTDVSLLTASGERLSGQVFVQPYHPLRAGREEPADIMNAPEPFFPIQTDGNILLVAKSAIAALEYDREGAVVQDGALPLGVSVTLDVTMSDGKNFSGSILVEGPVNTPRLLDFMNRATTSGNRFLELHNDARVRLLNRSHIETIRAVD
jgi:hypothetical protein